MGVYGFCNSTVWLDYLSTRRGIPGSGRAINCLATKIQKRVSDSPASRVKVDNDGIAESDHGTGKLKQLLRLYVQRESLQQRAFAIH
jgi:hypothetical protein